MNYQYIEQLIERYFSCQTTVQEEQILRSFFVGEDVPGHLMQYVELFRYEDEAKKEVLGSDFDERILEEIDKRENRSTSIQNRFAPFFRAAAVVAIILTVGSAADNAISNRTATETGKMLDINPYIRQADIPNTIKIRDTSQAEAKQQTDSLQIQAVDNNVR